MFSFMLISTDVNRDSGEKRRGGSFFFFVGGVISCFRVAQLVNHSFVPFPLLSKVAPAIR